MVDMRQIAPKTLSPLNRDVQPAQWALRVRWKKRSEWRKIVQNKSLPLRRSNLVPSVRSSVATGSSPIGRFTTSHRRERMAFNRDWCFS